MQNSIKANKDHCKYCFEVLIAKLTKQPPPQWPNHLPSIPIPIFVTWKFTKDHELRGCIGTFSDQDLKKVLPQYTLISALNDSRFEPISIDQIEHLTVAVSLLINFQKRNRPFDWQVGKHGIQIQFRENDRTFRGTYLPEVAAQQQWDQKQTLKQLIRKAGYRGDYNQVIEKIQLTTYQSSKESLSYEEYKNLIAK